MSTDSPKIEQQYDYKTFDVKMSDLKSGDLETVLNEHGDEGWELAERFEVKGTTLGFILKRPV